MDLIALRTSIIPDTSPAFTATVVVAGFLVVLLILTILIIVFSLFSKTMSKTQKKGKKKEEKAIMTKDVNVVSPFGAEPVQTASAPAPQIQQGVSEEIVAAISAAVYMMEGENAVITSIRPVRKNPINTRNPWAMAAIAQNTKPF